MTVAFGIVPRHEVHIKTESQKKILTKLAARLGKTLHKLLACSSACVQQVRQLLGLECNLVGFYIRLILIVTRSIWWFLTEGHLASAHGDNFIKS